MMFEQNSSYYDLLEVPPNANELDIRQAYSRLRGTYSRGSFAGYSLLDGTESEQMSRRLDEAYQVLSNPEKRRQYDQGFGWSGADELSDNTTLEDPFQTSIASTSESATDELFIAPATDYSEKSEMTFASHAPQTSTQLGRQEVPQEPERETTIDPREYELRQIIEGETEWRGGTLRKIRELKGVTLEDLMDHTKVNRRYTLAIEDESFDILPAAVYLRGFVLQIARYLGLPHEQVARAYVTRYRQVCPDKD